MTPDRARAEALFHDARGLDTGARDAFLAEACGGDDALRAEVEALLAADDAAADALRPPTGRDLQDWLAQSDALVGRTVGGCRITRRIAQGGMGLVYEAEQEEPRRAVALKIVRGAMLTDAARARFRHEARILGSLRHPGIAQIHRAGTHDADALPYFVMEYVPDARPLTAHADAQSLSTRARIELFLEVCDAVHFGHVKGVVHRDLKPDNILVGADGRPKVIDFGIAKATDPDLARTRHLTETGQLLGTLTYLSPEQLAGDPRLVDSRSDVYALGVVLYELLTGRLPYDLDGQDLLGIARTIAEKPPRLPAVGGDADVVLGKALAKEPERRYASAAALRDDLARYLDGQPIHARPPSTTYQLRLFAKRHKAVVAAGAIAALALVAGTVISLREAKRANEAAAEARAQTERAEREAARARGLLLESQRVTDVVAGDLFERVSVLPGSLAARAFLARTLQDALDGLTFHAGDDPELTRVAARTRVRLGEIYGLHGVPNLGETKRALDNVEQAIATLAALPAEGRVPRDLAIARARAADLHTRLGDAARGAELEAQARATLEELLAAAPDDEELLRDLTLLETHAAHRLVRNNDVKAALAHLGRAIRHGRAFVAAAPERAQARLLLARAQGLLAQRYVQVGAFAESAAALKEARATLAGAETLVPPGALHGPRSLLAFYAGDWAFYQRRLADAQKHYEECAGHQRAQLAQEPGDRRTRDNLAVTLSRLCQTHESLGKALHPNPLTAAAAEAGGARAQQAWRHYEQAVAHAQEQVALAKRIYDADRESLARLKGLQAAYADLGLACVKTSAWDASRAALEKADALARAWQERDPDAADGFLAEFQVAQRRYMHSTYRALRRPPAEARDHLQDALTHARRGVAVLERLRERGKLPQHLEGLLPRLKAGVRENEANLARVEARLGKGR